MNAYHEALLILFRQLQGSGELVGLHLHDDELDAFIAGRVVKLDEATVTIEQLDPDGRVEGKESFALDEIEGVHYGDGYLHGLRQLASRQLGGPKRFRTSGRRALTEAFEDGRAIAIEVEGDELFGFVRAISDVHVEFEPWIDYQQEGAYLIPLKNIVKISTNNPELRALDALATP